MSHPKDGERFETITHISVERPGIVKLRIELYL